MFFFFSFYKKESRLFVGNAWKENNFPFSRMNISFYFLAVRLEIWDGWEGQLKKMLKFLLFIGRGGFLFLFLFG